MTEHRDGMSMPARALKRGLDIVISAAGMVVLSPVYLVIYIAVKSEDHGKAIYKQKRVGYHGKLFTLYKFRSMSASAESGGKPLLCRGDNDKRLTKVGRFLREHHLDELPQLWNVLRGDMSLVGPRPERKYFVDKIMAINPDYELLYQLRPGVFSYATLYNGYTDTMEKMLKRLSLDLEYLDNRSIWFDARIVIETVLSIIFGKKF